MNDIFHYKKMHFYMLMSRDCNLSCPFCYQPKGFRQKKSMSKEVMINAMDFCLDNFDEQNITIVLFGGEPLLNFDNIKIICEKYPQISFVCITNGVLLDNKRIADFFIEHKNHIFPSVSIGNTRELYGDSWREKITPMLDVLKQTNSDCHYVVTDINRAFEDFKFLVEKLKYVRVSTKRQYLYSKEEQDAVFNEYKKIVDYCYFENRFNHNPCNLTEAFNLNIYHLLKNRPLHPNQGPLFCGCGNSYVICDIDGSLWPCDWFCGLQQYSYGSIYTGFNMDNVNEFKSFSTKAKELLYKDCNCDISKKYGNELCPRAICVAENYQNHSDCSKLTNSHCVANQIEFRIYEYFIKKAIELGVDEKFYNSVKPKKHGI